MPNGLLGGCAYTIKPTGVRNNNTINEYCCLMAMCIQLRIYEDERVQQTLEIFQSLFTVN